MLKYTLIFCCALLATGLVRANEEAEVKSSYREQDGQGHFKYGHDISNGNNQHAEGDVNGIHGEYFLPGENGAQIRVTYTADATGFHPKVEEQH